MKVHDAMSREIKSLGPQATIQQAAILMDREKIGLIPIVDADTTPMGVITDRDLTIRALANQMDPASPVSKVMTVGTHCVRENDELDRAIQLMQNEKVGRVLVCGLNGELVGVLSLQDAICDGGVFPHKTIQALHDRTPAARAKVRMI